MLVSHGPDVEHAAEVFKLLGNSSRLELLRLLAPGPRAVGDLAEASGLRQPMVSQHLRTLRQGGLVEATREGTHVLYAIADDHVMHIVRDAIAHAHESHDDHPQEGTS